MTLKAQGKRFSSFNLSGVNPVLGELIVVSRDTLARRRGTLVRFLRGVGKAMDSVLDDKDLDRTLGRLRGVDIPILADREAAKATLRQVSQAWTAAGRDNLLRSVPAQWTTNVRRLESTGVLKARVDPSRIYTNAVLQEARG